MVAYLLWYRVGTVDTSLSPLQPPEIEISKENVSYRKTKMLASCLEYSVGTVDTSLSPVRP